MVRLDFTNNAPRGRTCRLRSRLELAGIEVTEETLAVNEICKAGPNASFLGTPFTAKHFRKEHFLTALFDRRSMESWLKAGSKDISAVARAKAKKILKEHEPVPMDKGVIADLKEYIKKESKAAPTIS